MPQSLHCRTLCDDDDREYDDIDDDEDREYVIDNDEEEEGWNEVCKHTGE